MLNSAEHEILDVHKYKNIKKFIFIQAQISLKCNFSCSKTLKMPTIVGILTFMSRENFMLICVEHEIFYNLGAWSFRKAKGTHKICAPL